MVALVPDVIPDQPVGRRVAVARSGAVVVPPKPLSDGARSLYRSLAQYGPVQRSQVHLAADLAPGQSLDALSELMTIGLARDTDAGVIAIPQSQAVDDLLSEQAHALSRVLEDLRERQRRLRTLLQERDRIGLEDERVEAVSLDGVESSDLYRPPLDAGADLAALHPGGSFAPELLGKSLDVARSSVDRGVRLRVVHQSAALAHPRAVEYLTAVEEIGGHVRLRSNLPFRMMLIDGDAVVCSLVSADGSAETFLLRGRRIVAILGRVFETTWVDAAPLSRLVDAPHDERTRQAELDALLNVQQQAVLRYLAEGQTDQAIARHLGITSRTVTRRVGEIYAALGVESRFQAGVAARRLGLV